jgi:hypothetical protein
MLEPKLKLNLILKLKFQKTNQQFELDFRIKISKTNQQFELNFQ